MRSCRPSPETTSCLVGEAFFDILRGDPKCGLRPLIEGLKMKNLLILSLIITSPLLGQERKVAPTWLYRYVPNVSEQHADLSSSSCHYTPIFGEGDAESKALQSIVRFGEVTVDAHGACSPTEYPQ